MLINDMLSKWTARTMQYTLCIYTGNAYCGSVLHHNSDFETAALMITPDSWEPNFPSTCDTVDDKTRTQCSSAAA